MARTFKDHMHTGFVTSRRGMSLIELMVAMVIVALLMTIFFGVGRSVRAAAMSASCASNLRQCGVLLQMQAQEADGAFVALEGGTSLERTWITRLYLGGYMDRASLRLIKGCADWPMPPNSSDYYGFGMNNYYYDSEKKRFDAVPMRYVSDSLGSGQTVYQRYVDYDLLGSQASSHILLFDSVTLRKNHQSPEGVPYQFFRGNVHGAGTLDVVPRFQHSDGKANFLMMDGTVRSMNLSEFQDFMAKRYDYSGPVVSYPQAPSGE